PWSPWSPSERRTCEPRSRRLPVPPPRWCQRRSPRRPSAANPARRLADDPALLGLRGSLGRSGPPPGRRRADARDGLPERAAEPLEQRLLQRAPGKEFADVPPAAVPGDVAGGRLHRAGGLPALPEPDAGDPLAALAHRAVPAG